MKKGKHVPGVIYPWVLGQTKVWINNHGDEYTLSEMDPDYLSNVQGFLERRAHHYSDLSGRGYESFFKSLEWIRATPLYTEILVELFIKDINGGIYKVD